MRPVEAQGTPPNDLPKATGDQRSFPLGLSDVGQAPTQFVAQHLEKLVVGEAHKAHWVIAATDQHPIFGPEDRVLIRRSDHPVRFVRLADHEFFQVLRNKLGWGLPHIAKPERE